MKAEKTTIEKMVAWLGIGLGLFAKVIMATKPNVAVIVLIVATLLSALWAWKLRDRQSLVLHSVSVVLQVNTLLYWSQGIGLLDIIGLIFG